jgi:flagellar biogenesis protein FliO
VTRRNLLERTSPADDQRQPVRSLPMHAIFWWLFTVIPLVVILLLSLALWWLVWKLVSS